MFASRLIKAIIKLVSAGFTVFILLSNDVFEWFMSFPQTVVWLGAAIFTACLVALILAEHHWPHRFKPYREGIKRVLGQLRDSLFDFVIAFLIVRAFYPLDMLLLPYYQNPWVLASFVLELLLLLDLWSLRNDSDWGYRTLKFFWERVR